MTLCILNDFVFIKMQYIVELHAVLDFFFTYMGGCIINAFSKAHNYYWYPYFRRL